MTPTAIDLSVSLILSLLFSKSDVYNNFFFVSEAYAEYIFLLLLILLLSHSLSFGVLIFCFLHRWPAIIDGASISVKKCWR